MRGFLRFPVCQAFYLMWVVLIVASCGVEVSTSSATVNDKPAAEYYAQFEYRKTSERPTVYQYLTSNSVSFATDTSQRDVSFTIDLFLLNTGSYRAIYQEWTAINGWKVQSHRQTIEGSWNVDGTNLVLSGLGTATGIVVYKVEMVSLKLQTDFHTPGVAQKSTLLSKLTSSESMEEKLRSAFHRRIANASH